MIAIGFGPKLLVAALTAYNSGSGYMSAYLEKGVFKIGAILK
ncbi:MAG: hypothetical protein ACT6FE_04420 [Methanosarcinaceae archaeon]